MTVRVYQIRNADNEAICERATKKACIEILNRCATDPPTLKGWSNGPYFVMRVEKTLVYRHRPRTTPARSKP